MFWENYVRLCNQKNRTPNAIAKELKFSSGSVTNWKNGACPQDSSLVKIADYFGVTPSELIGEAEPTSQKLSPVQREAWELIQEMDDETLTRFINAAKAMLGI